MRANVNRARPGHLRDPAKTTMAQRGDRNGTSSAPTRARAPKLAPCPTSPTFPPPERGERESRESGASLSLRLRGASTGSFAVGSYGSWAGADGRSTVDRGKRLIAVPPRRLSRSGHRPLTSRGPVHGGGSGRRPQRGPFGSLRDLITGTSPALVEPMPTSPSPRIDAHARTRLPSSRRCRRRAHSPRGNPDHHGRPHPLRRRGNRIAGALATDDRDRRSQRGLADSPSLPDSLSATRVREAPRGFEPCLPRRATRESPIASSSSASPSSSMSAACRDLRRTHAIEVADGRTLIVDCFWPDVPPGRSNWTVASHHADWESAETDRARDAALHRHRHSGPSASRGGACTREPGASSPAAYDAADVPSSGSS